ncbi:hypothetical protein [Longimycelium tulufanense]|nr:hypothetical protein [Longimycelium tulufanense]
MAATKEAPGNRPAARLVSNVLGPEVWVALLPLAVAWEATGQRIGPTLGWGLWIVLFAVAVPMLVMVQGARQGQWRGRYVDNREGRLVPYLACILSVFLGLVGLWVGDAPSDLVAFVVAMLLSLVLFLYITVAWRWKISLHAAVATGASAALVVAYGPWALAVAPLAACAAWSRVALGKHTVGQVLAGAVVSVVFGGCLFWAVQAWLA